MAENWQRFPPILTLDFGRTMPNILAIFWSFLFPKFQPIFAVIGDRNLATFSRHCSRIFPAFLERNSSFYFIFPIFFFQILFSFFFLPRRNILASAFGGIRMGIFPSLFLFFFGDERENWVRPTTPSRCRGKSQ